MIPSGYCKSPKQVEMFHAVGERSNANLIDQFTEYQRARAFSEHTITRRQSSLRSFCRFVAPLKLGEVSGLDVEEGVGTPRTPRTRHAYRSDLSAFYRWATRRRLAGSNPVAETDPVKVPKGLPRPIPIHAVPILIAAAPMPLRLALALAAYAGLRCAEIAALTTDDIQLHGTPLLVVRGGKGAKDRVVPLHPELVALLAERRTQGRLVAWTPAHLGKRASAHMRRHGYNCTLHQARHSFGTELARVLDGNVVAVGRLMGRSSPNTTQGYIGWAGGDTADKVVGLYVA